MGPSLPISNYKKLQTRPHFRRPIPPSTQPSSPLAITARIYTQLRIMKPISRPRRALQPHVARAGPGEGGTLQSRSAVSGFWGPGSFNAVRRSATPCWHNAMRMQMHMVSL